MTTTTENPRAVIGNNAPPADATPPTQFELITKEIADLYDEAKNFCDGEAIDSEEVAAAVTKLHDDLHDAGKRAEALRVEEKEPLDKQIAAIQTKFHPLIGNTKAGKGKVILGKESCQSLLTPWRRRIADEKAAEARRIAEAAAAEKAKAEAAMQASRGNLAAREEAEALVASAKSLEKAAARVDRGPTGLRTVWHAEIVDEELALDWCFARAKSEFMALVQRNADEVVRAGVRVIPGVRVYSEQVAR